MKQIKLKNLSQEEIKDLLPDNLLFLGYRGSIAHGMYVPNSNPNSIDDRDLIGAFMAPWTHYLGLKQVKETKEKFYGAYDCVFYEAKKLISLLVNGNPNVLSILWLEPQHIIYQTEFYKLFRENRELFFSKKIYHAFVGYARAQLKRMTHCNFEGYMGKKRKKLVEKFGYDCKNASHLIRLLTMGIEFLKEKTLYVERKYDAKYLMAIKKGEYTLEEIQQRSSELFNLAEQAYLKTDLPNLPDYDKINTMLVDYFANRLRDDYYWDEI
jgi:predicted nucleotidyltransferase